MVESSSVDFAAREGLVHGGQGVLVATEGLELNSYGQWEQDRGMGIIRVGKVEPEEVVK